MRRVLATLIAAVVTACSSSGTPVVTSAIPSSTPTLAFATTTPSATAATASPTVRPSPTPITDLSQVFRPLAAGWRPTGPTLVIGRQSDGGEATLVALPFGSGGRVGAPTPIVRLPGGSWALRPDGGAVVSAVWTGGGGQRLAIWDIRSGDARWLTSEDAAGAGGSPVWSKDGSSIYYVSVADGKPAIFQIGADGSARKQLFAHERIGSLDGMTPDGRGLVWSLGQAGGSVEILDLTSGVSRHIENVARAYSWRAQQPRLLLSVGGCCAGRPGGSLVAWDDFAMTSRVVAERGQYGDPAFGGGAWDPSGNQIAAVRFDNTSPYQGSLVILDPTSGTTRPVASTQGVGSLIWLPEGIVFSISRTQPSGFELRLLAASGGTAASLYDDAGYIQRIDVIRP